MLKLIDFLPKVRMIEVYGRQKEEGTAVVFFLEYGNYFPEYKTADYKSTDQIRLDYRNGLGEKELEIYNKYFQGLTNEDQDRLSKWLQSVAMNQVQSSEIYIKP